MSMDDAYQSPTSDLTTGPERMNLIRTMYAAQNGVLGVIAGAAASLLVAIVWNEATVSDKYISPLFLILSGVLVGGAVRYCGSAISVSLRYVAVFFHLLCCFLALFVMGVPMVARLSGPALALVFLLVGGSYAAFLIARRSLTDDQKDLVWRQESVPEDFKMQLYNRTWVIVVTAVLCACVNFILAVLWIILTAAPL